MADEPIFIHGPEVDALIVRHVNLALSLSIGYTEIYQEQSFLYYGA